MRSIPTKRAAALLGGGVALVALALVAVDAVDDRNGLWAHAAATTGGDPDALEPYYYTLAPRNVSINARLVF